MRATLKTINQMLAENENLLNFVTVPADITDIDTASLKLAIIRRCGDVEPYYQKDSDFQLFGALWFTTHKFLFAHAVELWNATYNPIENYDRTETETITGTKTEENSNTDTHSGTDTTTKNLTDGTNVTRESDIAGFNSSSYSDANRETETGTDTHTGTESLAHGEQIATSGTASEDSETTRNSRIHGNIGVTTAQQMIEAEMALANKFWIYDYIANAFESDNFITVYKSYYDGVQFDDV